MGSPTGRLVGALLLLLIFHSTLFVWRPAGRSGRATLETIDAAMLASGDAYASGRYRDALEPTELLCEEFPTQHVYLRRLAYIHQNLGHRADEARAWDGFMTVSPTPWEGCPMVAEAHRAAGNETAATAAFERCVQLDPRNTDLLLLLGQAYTRAGRPVDARRALETAISLDEDYADLHLVLGIRDYADGREPDARRHFERFLQLSPDRKGEVAVWLSRTDNVR